MNEPTPSGEIVLYQTEDGMVRLECRVEKDTIWLTQRLIAELYQKDVRTISEHLRNIYEEAELAPEATIRKFRIVRTEGSRRVSREVEHYNLDAILAVGFRVRSARGTAFRQWAAERLKEYLVKGFALDDARLKVGGGGLYFEELLERIRDIRSSEKVFWRKVLDIYATSVDYDPRNDLSKEFFATIQNKMHWATHGQTAAEIIHSRANAKSPNMGLTAWPGDRMTRADIAVAKNYLSKDELDALNRIVTAYLEFAELQALNRRPMKMQDWVDKLDDFLRMSERDILNHAGKIAHDDAVRKAEQEYAAFRKKQLEAPSRAEIDFEHAVQSVKRIADQKRKPSPRKKQR